MGSHSDVVDLVSSSDDDEKPDAVDDVSAAPPKKKRKKIYDVGYFQNSTPAVRLTTDVQRRCTKSLWGLIAPDPSLFKVVMTTYNLHCPDPAALLRARAPHVLVADVDFTLVHSFRGYGEDFKLRMEHDRRLEWALGGGNNVVRSAVPPSFYGSYHGKVVLAYYRGKGIRVIVHTSNFGVGFETSLQAAWYQDFPLKTTKRTEGSFTANIDGFGADLHRYMSHDIRMQSFGEHTSGESCPVCGGEPLLRRRSCYDDLVRRHALDVDDLLSYDYSSANVQLIWSLPGTSDRPAFNGIDLLVSRLEAEKEALPHGCVAFFGIFEGTLSHTRLQSTCEKRVGELARHASMHVDRLARSRENVH